MNQSKKITCLIPDTHNRLNQSFILFQSMKDGYHDELLFTSHLNNIIQALRNVTFVMQKELAHIVGFKDWYDGEQNEMKQDESLKWLVSARNHIVKEGDLKKFSYTKVNLKDHYEKELFAAQLNAKISMEFVAEYFRKKIEIPKELKEYVVIEAERIWIVEDFPKTEIIDVLIHCFGMLTDLVYSAHEYLLHTNALLCEKNLHVFSDEDYMVKLHNSITKGRIVRILCSSGEILSEMNTVIHRTSDKSMEVIEQRYPKTKQLIQLVKNEKGGNIPFSKIPYHVESAKQFMEIDGGLLPVVFLYFSDKQPIIEFLGMSRPADRYLMFEHIAQRVAETRCIAVITISEFWGGDLPKRGQKYVPASIQKKREGIGIVAASPSRLDHYTIEITRNKTGKPLLGKEYHNKNMNPEKMLSFKRIYDVWNNSDWAN